MMRLLVESCRHRAIRTQTILTTWTVKLIFLLKNLKSKLTSWILMWRKTMTFLRLEIVWNLCFCSVCEVFGRYMCKVCVINFLSCSVQIYDGDGSLLFRRSGTLEDLPFPVFSRLSQVSVHFTSDYSFSRSGFTLSFERVDGKLLNFISIRVHGHFTNY